MRFESATNNGSYNVKLHDLTVVTGPGQGIVAMGRPTAMGRYQIYACSISADHRNDMYPTDDDNVCHNSANPYDIHLRFVGSGTVINDNVLRSGNNFGGSRV